MECTCGSKRFFFTGEAVIIGTIIDGQVQRDTQVLDSEGCFATIFHAVCEACGAQVNPAPGFRLAFSLTR